jgi:hypothetical protein
MIGLIISRDKDNWLKIRKGGKRGLNSSMRSLFSFLLCSCLQTTQTAVLQLRHRRDHASLLPCLPTSPSGRVLILSAPRARLRPRLLADRVADSLSRKKRYCLFGGLI